MFVKRITVGPSDRAEFNNITDMCVGTGRVDLALHAEYQRQLRAVQEVCRFRYIRGHGLFSDQMGIYQHFTGPDGKKRVWYCFTYLDRVVDAWLDAGLRPFIETGFMPSALTDSPNTLFYWQAHTAPPRVMKEWTDLVQAALRHLAERYGRAEVESWPVEIWNEPNLPGFWENADKAKYLELYRATVLAVKEVLPGMRTGGPAICGGEGSQQWIRDFLTFCRDNAVPVDFVTRHAYMGMTPKHRGRYLYHDMRTPEDLTEEMRISRQIIRSFPEYRDLPLYITEFNTSYNPFCPIHDTNYNAALCAGVLSRIGDAADMCSYWTFGDVFEEQGIPTHPFHGGFGLTANDLIPKPTLWTFAFFAGLKGDPVYRDENAVIVHRADGGYEAVLWNLGDEEQVEISLPLPDAVVLTERVDGECCDPLRAWHLMGEPESLTEEQLRFLRRAAQPRAEALPAPEGKVLVTLARNAVVRLKALPAPGRGDEGYDYAYYCKD